MKPEELRERLSKIAPAWMEAGVLDVLCQFAEELQQQAVGVLRVSALERAAGCDHFWFEKRGRECCRWCGIRRHGYSFEAGKRCLECGVDSGLHAGHCPLFTGGARIPRDVFNRILATEAKQPDQQRRSGSDGGEDLNPGDLSVRQEKGPADPEQRGPVSASADLLAECQRLKEQLALQCCAVLVFDLSYRKDLRAIHGHSPLRHQHLWWMVRDAIGAEKMDDSLERCHREGDGSRAHPWPGQTTFDDASRIAETAAAEKQFQQARDDAFLEVVSMIESGSFVQGQLIADLVRHLQSKPAAPRVGPAGEHPAKAHAPAPEAESSLADIPAALREHKRAGAEYQIAVLDCIRSPHAGNEDRRWKASAELDRAAEEEQRWFRDEFVPMRRVARTLIVTLGDIERAFESMRYDEIPGIIMDARVKAGLP